MQTTTTKKPKERKQFTTTLDKELLLKTKEYALRHDTTVNVLIESLLQTLVGGQEHAK